MPLKEIHNNEKDNSPGYVKEQEDFAGRFLVQDDKIDWRPTGLVGQKISITTQNSKDGEND